MNFLGPYKYVLDAIIIAALLAGAFYLRHLDTTYQQSIGAARVQAQWDAQRLADATAQRATEIRQQKEKDDAEKQADKQRQVLAAAATAAAQSGRLLDTTLQTIRTGASTATRDAIAASLTACTTVLGTMAQTGGRISAEADAHAADSMMYQQAWPK